MLVYGAANFAKVCDVEQLQEQAVRVEGFTFSGLAAISMGGETLNDFARTLIHLSDDRLQRDYLNAVAQTEAIAQALPQLDPNQACRIVRLGLDIDLGLGSTLAGSLAPDLQPQGIQLILDLGLSKVATVTLLKLTGSPAALPYLQLGLENDPDYFEALRLEFGYEAESVVSEPNLIEDGIEEDEPFEIMVHRHQIAAAIASIKHPETVRLLHKHLSDGNTQDSVRYTILRSLEDCSNSQTTALLLDLVKEPPNWMLEAPENCIKNNLCHHISLALLRRGYKDREILEPGLWEMLDSPPGSCHPNMAMEGLAELGVTSAVGAIAEFVGYEPEQSDWLRSDALSALAKLGGSLADELIRHALCHPDADPPHVVAYLYRDRWGSKQGAVEVAQCLQGDDSWIQQQALRVLRYLVRENPPRGRRSTGTIEGGITALEILEQSLDATTQSVRLLAAQLLTELIAEPALGLDYFRHIHYSKHDYRVTEPLSSEDCLDRLDREKILHVLTAQFAKQDLEQQKATLQSLAWLQANDSKLLLLQTLQQAPEPTIRSYAGRALGYFRDRSVLPDLITTLTRETDPEVRAQIAIGLCHYTEVTPIPPELETVFLALAQDALDSTNTDHARVLHASIPYALSRIGGETAIKMLEQLLYEYGGDSTIRALGRIASPYAVNLINQALVDTLQPSPQVFYDVESLIRALAKAGTPQAFDALLEPLPYGHAADTHTRDMLVRHGRLEHVPRLWEALKRDRSTGFLWAIEAIQKRCDYYNSYFMTTDPPTQPDSSPSLT